MTSRKLICVLILFLLVYCGQLFAKPVSAEKAQQAVKGWLKADSRPFGATLGQQLKKTDTFRDEQGQVIYYVVYLQPSGFVIVLADDTLEPVLAFSDHGTYNPSLTSPLGALVNKDTRGRFAASREILANPGPKTQTLQEKTSKWERLAGGDPLPMGPGGPGLQAVSDPRVDQLLKTKWDQTTCCSAPNLACYNYYTFPYGYGDPNNYPCGCVATAMAQVMRYHKYPTGSIGPQTFIFSVWTPGYGWAVGYINIAGLAYDWASMVYEPNCNTTELQRQAIGTLCAHAGFSVHMQYGPGGSSASLGDVNAALVDVFMYSNCIYKSGNPVSVGNLITMINPNLDYKHPVIIGFPGEEIGHAVVTDGYGYNIGTMYHHINMGWAGDGDAWYNFYNDMPAGYNSVDGCVYNIFTSGTGEIISGRVTSTSGNPLEGVTVTAVRTGGGTYQAVTNDRGIYALAPVPSASTYTISVTNPRYNFSRVVNTNTSVRDGAIGNYWGADFTVPVRYVDANAPGANNGSSWLNAYHYLQDALADPCAAVIWVADGTYYPDSNSSEPNGNGDRNKSFVLKNSVAIYGGFAGFGAPDPNARNVKLYESILSGDLNDNDVYVADPCNLRTEPTRAENSYHVVTSNSTDANTILDGFTVTAGNANTSVWPTGNGGGMLNVESSCTINNCTFIENSAELGGAIYNHHSTVHISNCDFIRNGAKYDSGGVSNDSASCPTLVNCSFVSNYSSNNGGGLRNWGHSNPIVVNCLFNHNSSNYGGGVCNFNDCSPTLINCTFRGNWATTAGGGIDDYNNSSPVITNCILWGNTAPASPQIGEGLNSAAIVTYSDIQDGWGGVGNINADPRFVDANGQDGVIGTLDDNLRLLSNSPCIDKGNNASVPADTTDLDGDGNTIEKTPLDLDLRPRFADGNCDGNNVVDMGAYEFSYAYAGDFDGDCDVDFFDFAILANSWMQNNPLLDIAPAPAGDGIVDIKDLAVLCDNWLAGK
jgi:hypothetical protein